MATDALERLLTVQTLDTTTDQLRHRRAHLPERAQLADCERRTAAVDARIADVQGRRDELERAEKRLADEVSILADKAKAADQKLYGGTVSAIRELTALQEEIASLQRRQHQLEDEELELMEQVEPLDTQLAELTGERAALDGEAAGYLAVIAEQEVVLDADLERVGSERSAAVDGVPAPLLEEYERLRRGLDGIGVARLTGNRCEGCHLTLSAVDVDQIRHQGGDEIAHCTECGRILVPS